MKNNKISKYNKEKLSNMAYQLQNTEDSWIKQNPSKWSEMQKEYRAFYKKLYGHDARFDTDDYARGGNISRVSLKKYFYNNALKHDDLIGLRVFHANSGDYVYIKEIDGMISNATFPRTLWAGKNKDDEFGHSVDTEDLFLFLSKDVYDDNDETYAKGGNILKGFDYSIGGL